MEIFIPGWNFNSVYLVEKNLPFYEKFHPWLKCNGLERIENLEADEMKEEKKLIKESKSESVIYGLLKIDKFL